MPTTPTHFLAEALEYFIPPDIPVSRPGVAAFVLAAGCVPASLLLDPSARIEQGRLMWRGKDGDTMSRGLPATVLAALGGSGGGQLGKLIDPEHAPADLVRALQQLMASAKPAKMTCAEQLEAAGLAAHVYRRPDLASTLIASRSAGPITADDERELLSAMDETLRGCGFQ